MKHTGTATRGGNLSVRTLLYLAIGMQIVLALVIGLLGVRGMYSTLNGLDNVYTARVIPLRDLKVISDEYAVAVVNATQKVRDGTVTPEDGAAAMEGAQKLIAEKWKTYRSGQLSARERELADAAEPLMAKGNELIATLVDRLKLGALSEVHATAERLLYPTMDPITAAIRELIELQLDLARQGYEAEQSGFNQAVLVMLAFIVGAAALSGVGGFVFARNFLMRPLDDARRFANDIAAGNLGTSIQIHRDDEIGSLAAALQKMQQELRSMVRMIQDNAERIAAASENLAGNTGEISRATEQQSSAAEAIAAAIEQMTTSINHVSAFTADARGIATESGNTSRAGAEVIQRVVHDIERVAQSVDQSAAAIRTLGQRSKEIASVVTVIKEVADQTNLLALNAAIEAARAGEQGRGFAVVADEVRKLAERTSAATSEIGTMINAIQDETRTAISSIREGSNQAHAGAQLAQQAAGSLERINQGAQQTMERIDEIAVAIAQQSREADSVVGHVRHIMDMVERNSTGAADTLQEAQSLESLAANLHEISKVFRLGSEGEQAMQVHKRMPEIVQQAAREVGKLLEDAIAAGQLTEEAAFDSNYQPIPNTRPQKFNTRFDSLTDKVFPRVQEAVLDRNAEAVYAIGCDRKGYVPTHNKRFSQPLTGDYDKDFVGNRSKRVFDDPVGKQCGAHELEFLIQTYRRDTGEIMHDISAPVYVKGRHWGGFRIGYKA